MDRVALAAAWHSQRAPDEPMVLMSSDHYIKDAAIFRQVLQVAGALVQEQGSLVNIGIVPSFPNDKLGYLKARVQLACDSEDLGPGLREWLPEFAASLAPSLTK